MLLKNVRCKQACSGATVSEAAALIFCKEILFFTGALCVSDIVAETVLVCHSFLQFHGGSGRGKLPFIEQYVTMRIWRIRFWASAGSTSTFHCHL
jgi:hypothetical protein